MARKRKEPEVVVFEEPSFSRKSRREIEKERHKFLRGDVSEIFADNGPPSKDSKTCGESSAEEFNLKSTLREVQSLAASSFTGKTKRKFEEEQIRSLGAKPPKSEYVPYPHYQMVAKTRREKEKRLNEEMGIPHKKKKRDRGGKVVKGRGRWKDTIKSLEPSVGKFKNGVLKLSGKDLAKVRK